MKLYIDLDEVRDDGTVSDLMAELKKTPETAIATEELIARIVQLANSHIWGFLIGSIQEQENAENGEILSHKNDENL